MPISAQITSKLSLRLDEEKGPSTPIQKPPYHPALISGSISSQVEADAPPHQRFAWDVLLAT